MSEADSMTPGQIASHTFAYLRRIENQLKSVFEVLIHHDTRLGRLETSLGEVKRDVGEVKRDVNDVRSNIVLLENQMLSRMTEIIDTVRRFDDQNDRIAALETASYPGQ